jgi:spermidine/putrescine transport system substrate-binding protein
MEPGLLTSPELSIPPQLVGAAIEQKLCAPAEQELYTRIWTELMR